MAEEHIQKTQGAMAYPRRGTWNRVLFKSPLIWWRMGLGPLMSHSAWGGNKMLVLTTWGRFSQKPRHTMLSYVSVDDRVYVCSGWGAKSDWYKNILVNPLVTICAGKKIYPAQARRVNDLDEYTKITEEMFKTGGDSHFEVWLDSFGIEHNKEDMIAKRDRLYLVGFDLSDEPGPPTLKIDLRWIWGVIVVLVFAFLILIR
jgi:deazaflavin-dependent oxidoreductase (nitroreductase family)